MLGSQAAHVGARASTIGRSTMYEAFYGLRERPFNLTPDPKYLYLSDKHKEAFAHLLFGIQNRSGFVMVTGEIGTGKTTICRNLINQLDQKIDLALIFNPSLNPVELMQKINDEFGIRSDSDNLRVLVDNLNEFLLSTFAAGRSSVLIIDEAQNLSPAVLEQIRLLSNLETETEKLLQIILIGQPELGDKLALHELRQLNQRITARYHLNPLSEKETLQYINYRLHVAGGRRKVRFDKRAIHAIYKFSGGTPRVINAICDRCLLIGYTKELHTITQAVAKQAIREIRGAYVQPSRRLLHRIAAALPGPKLYMAAAVALVVALGLGAVLSQPVRDLARELSNFNKLIAEDGGPDEEKPTGMAAALAPKTPQPEASPAVKRLAESIMERQDPAPEPDSEPTLEELLTASPPADALRAASAAVLAAWGKTLVGEYPADPAVEAIGDFAQRHELSQELLKPALDQLLAIDLPALVKVRAGGETRWVGLIGYQDGKVRLTGGLGESIEAPRDALRDMYASEALVLWADPTPGAGALLQGRRSPAVAKFKQQLRELGRLRANNNSDEYDNETATAVSRVQSETGLLLDGMAGRQVRMVLTSWVPSFGAPNLSDGSVQVPTEEGLSTAAVVLDAKSPQRAEASPAPAPKPDAAAPEPAPEPVVEAVASPQPAPEPVVEPVAAPDPAPEPAPEAPTEIDAAPAPEPVPAEENPLPSATPPAEAPVAAEGEAATAPEMVRVQELEEPFPGEAGFESVESDERKEITPPLDGNSPLVPAEE